jgi:hypothetical protein
MPELLSHCSSSWATVRQVLDVGLDTLLVARQVDGTPLVQPLG